jgi:hypothetical protein
MTLKVHRLGENENNRSGAPRRGNPVHFELERLLSEVNRDMSNLPGKTAS